MNPSFFGENNLVVKHDQNAEKFYIEFEEGEARLEYSKKEDYIDFYKVFIPQELRGRSLAKEITITALDYAMEKGLKVKPSCPYVEIFLKRNKKYRDLIYKIDSN